MPSSKDVVTNFRDSNNVDLGKKLVTKEYFLDAYPAISQQLGISPELWTWGWGAFGQLGNNTIDVSVITPITTFAGGSNWKQIEIGYRRAGAIKTDGTLWVWGRGLNGELGINLTQNRLTPVQTFVGGNNWKHIRFGTYFATALKTDGTLWTWGSNVSGQLGINSTSDRFTPVQTSSGGTDWKYVSAGENHAVAIKTNGTLWVWGWNDAGQLGLNDTNDRSVPVEVFGGGTWKQVSCGIQHTAGIKTDGTLWVWGRNFNAQLGLNDTTTITPAVNKDRYTPTEIFGGGNNWKQVACGFWHTAAIKTDGTLWTWGSSANGQRGDNSIFAKLTPLTTFAGGNNWKYVACGNEVTTAIKTDGTLWVWGFNTTDGALGINSTTEKILTPVTTFAGGNNWKTSSAANKFSGALKSIDF
jgi:hypothetical protein